MLASPGRAGDLSPRPNGRIGCEGDENSYEGKNAGGLLQFSPLDEGSFHCGSSVAGPAVSAIDSAPGKCGSRKSDTLDRSSW